MSDLSQGQKLLAAMVAVFFVFLAIVVVLAVRPSGLLGKSKELEDRV